jgi:hypothetical protein
MDELGILIGAMVIGLIGGGVLGVYKNPYFAFMGIAAAGFVVFGVVFRTPITPSGTDSGVLGIPGLIGLLIGGAAGWYLGEQMRKSNQ